MAFACDLCAFRSAHKRSLRRHRGVHTGQRFVCGASQCRYVTTWKDALRVHQRLHADGPAAVPYACDFCAFRTRHLSSLAVHTRTHTHEKPYVCIGCGFRAVDCSNLTRHMRGCANVLPKPRRSGRPVTRAAADSMVQPVEIARFVSVAKFTTATTLSPGTLRRMATMMGHSPVETLYLHNQPHLTGNVAAELIGRLSDARFLRGINLGELRMGGRSWTLLERVLGDTGILHLYLDDGGSAANSDHPGDAYIRRLEKILQTNQRTSGVFRGDPRIAAWSNHLTKPRMCAYPPTVPT